MLQYQNVIPMQNIAVIGTGISGMSAAWLLSHSCNVTVYEKDDRIGGHSNTVSIGEDHIDTGFIVYNEPNYPNLTALFSHLGVETAETDMSFAVSLGGKLEYAGHGLDGLFAQRRNVFNARFLTMVYDLLRFYRQASDLDLAGLQKQTLGDYLRQNGYSDAFIYDHLLPMGAAIWSTPVGKMLDYPLASFLRFCQNHGLIRLKGRPQWRTVCRGSQAYVDKLTATYKKNIRLNCAVDKIKRYESHVEIIDRQGQSNRYDQIIIATHADQALKLLASPSRAEEEILGAFSYSRNLAILHSDPALMPKNKRAWASWNYLSQESGETQADDSKVSVTYWMNRLQHIPSARPYFVTLNPIEMPAEGSIYRSFLYDHPVFDTGALAAQKNIWGMQGKQRTWYCGSYLGYGFHEDGLQSGLAVAEKVGAVKRPWAVEQQNGRIDLPEDWGALAKIEPGQAVVKERLKHG
ncbi:MAG: NAD/FAD-binding protein [Kordiimonas sp.]|nr:NAD/FAD-binding protein [Kordiimonas sp.]|tara:strand:- start:7086 stop:8474 length:1389 start_codon:yes stop_codon:yes gene_type:complete